LRFRDANPGYDDRNNGTYFGEEPTAMHLSTHNWMRAEPLEVTLKRIKKFGYESIEISGEPEQYKPRRRARC
jgi:hypothetical protein